MSIYSRDYMKEEEPRRGFGGPSSWNVVTWLVAVNVAVYLFNNVFFYNPRREWFGLSWESLTSLRLWTPLTYQFVHASLWHLLANMLGLFFLGRMLLQFVAPRQVLAIYLLGGLVGGALQLAWNLAAGSNAVIVGASGSVLAIVFAAITLAPYHRLQLLLFFILPVNLSMRQLGWLIIGMNALTLLLPGALAGGRDQVAVMAHFGGMLWGWGHIRLGLHSRDWSRTRSTKPKKAVGKRAASPSAAPSAKRTPFVAKDIDAILDKINEHGFQSLTEEERRTLEQGSQRLSRRLDRDP